MKINRSNYLYLLVYILKHFIFWLVFAAFGRMIFYLYNIRETSSADLIDIFASFYHALYLDISFASYMLIIPFFLFLFQSLFRANILNYINKWFTYLILFLVSAIVSSELGIYEEWHEKLSFKALSYLARPDEVYRTAKASILILGTILIAIQVGIGVWVYNKFVFEKIEIKQKNYLFSFIWLILMPGFILLGMRGGIQEIPISQSAVYFSKNNYINLGTVNSAWNLFFSIDNNSKYKNKNPFIYYPLNEAKHTIDSLFYTESDSTINILNIKKPNIVVVLLESWTADVIEPLGGYSGYTPRFSELAKEGMLFTNHYSNGMLSHQAVVALYSGFPSTPTVDIIKHADKYENLPCFPQRMKNYYSSFYFGGHLHYGNIKSYIYFNQFDNIVEVSDFDDSYVKGKMGVHDEGLYDRLLLDIPTFKKPFLCGAFTLSSHSPFDFPMEEVIHEGEHEKPYLNSIYYADSCLGDFFDRAKEQDWYDNTLFVLMADHSHGSPRKWNYYSVEKRKTPMLFIGNALKEEYRGTTYDKFSSQLDVSKTLLAQLGEDYSGFNWSRNLFNPSTPNFTFYTFDDGFGFIFPDDYLVYNERFSAEKKVYIDSTKTAVRREELLRYGKSYMQVLFQEYLDY